MKYELKTIRDIYEKIPIDRIDDCLKELAIAIKQAKATIGLLKEVEKDISGKEPQVFADNNSRFPDVITWNDDGKGEILTHIVINNEPQFIVKSTLKKSP